MVNPEDKLLPVSIEKAKQMFQNFTVWFLEKDSQEYQHRSWWSQIGLHCHQFPEGEGMRYFMRESAHKHPNFIDRWASFLAENPNYKE